MYRRFGFQPIAFHEVPAPGKDSQFHSQFISELHSLSFLRPVHIDLAQAIEAIEEHCFHLFQCDNAENQDDRSATVLRTLPGQQVG